ncbi:MAG TPA: low molecular weight protein-tyrosine-phosphatase [Steroidobacteraceae bacterium]|nr:low molecular weight protein-tyrosine-phosphatase [Steroidobacteraceae bacterium]
MTREPFRILFVCLGNICRSPTAEGVVRHLLASRAPELEVEVDSAGTGDYHVGSAPDQRAQRAARLHGIDLGDLRARQVEAKDFERFDLILAMDRQNLQALEVMRPRASRAELALFLEYTGHPGAPEVPDPYQGTADDFELALDLIQAASRRLIALLREQHA